MCCSCFLSLVRLSLQSGDLSFECGDLVAEFVLSILGQTLISFFFFKLEICQRMISIQLRLLLFDLIKPCPRVLQFNLVFLSSLLPLSRALLGLSQALASSCSSAVAASRLVLLVFEASLQGRVFAFENFAAVTDTSKLLKLRLVRLANKRCEQLNLFGCAAKVVPVACESNTSCSCWSEASACTAASLSRLAKPACNSSVWICDFTF